MLIFGTPVAPPKHNHTPQPTAVDGPSGEPAPRFLSYAERFDSQDTNWKKKGAKGFKLIQCYPTEEPMPTEKELPWYDKEKNKELDFHDPAEWEDYLVAVLRYCFEGGALSAEVPQKKSEARWFHTPWLHSGGTGREPIHGLTYERVSEPGELSLRQESRVQNWAVGLYNALGGYVIGRVWENPDCPDATKARFKHGTVAIKLLFTEASIIQAPYLSGQGDHEWDAYVYKDLPKDPKRPDGEAKREIKKLRLLQIDLAVRDERSEGTGWVFGTFVYHKDNGIEAYPGCDIKKNPWCRVVPVGLMWGNDPDLSRGEKPQESLFNNPDKLPDELMKARNRKIGLGWGGRLNGPVDNPESSCLSCHATASLPQFERVPLSDLRLEEKKYWFRNFKVTKAGGPAFWPGTETLDYSLQLSSGIRNFYQARDGESCKPEEAKRIHEPHKALPRPQVMRDSDH
jgi:hypothetical protein